MRQVTRGGQIMWAIKDPPPPEQAVWNAAELRAWDEFQTVLHRTLTLIAMIATGLIVGLAAGWSK